MKRDPLFAIAVCLSFLPAILQAQTEIQVDRNEGSGTNVRTNVQVYQAPASTHPAVGQQPAVVPAPVPAASTPAVVVPAVAAPVSIAVATEAKDDDDEFDGMLVFGPGLATFNGDAGDYLDDAFSIDVGFYGELNDVSQMGLEFGYIPDANIEGQLPGRLAPDLDGDGLPDIGVRGDSTANIARATPVINIGPLIRLDGKFKVQPYIGGGGGFYWTHYDGNAAEDDDYNGGWNAGGGFMFHLGDDVGLGFDIRHHNIIYKNAPDVTYLTPSGRIALLFN